MGFDVVGGVITFTGADEETFPKSEISEFIPDGTKATVCGCNIKPYEEYDTWKTKGKKGKCRSQHHITCYGLYLHLKLPNGGQLDVMWELEKADIVKGETFCNYPRRKKPTWMKKSYGKEISISVLHQVLKLCNANEWVELIGKEVIIDCLDFHKGNDPMIILQNVNSDLYRICVDDYKLWK